MGLDMYLFQRDPSNMESDIELGYWRKFNALHGLIWFMKMEEYEDDNTTEMVLTAIEIESILSCLKEVKQILEEDCTYETYEDGEQYPVFTEAAIEKATDLLSPYPGIFFGSYEIDLWYYHNIKRSIPIFEKALELAEEGEEIYYYAWY